MRTFTNFLALGITFVATLAGAAPDLSDASPRVVATYFHRTFRCQTCLRIESLAQFDVTEARADAVEGGRLFWRAVNIDDEGNAGFEKQFELEGSSLVITLEDGDKVLDWVRLDRTWELYGDVKAFDAYVLGAIDEYLAAAAKRGSSETPGR